MEDGLDKGVNKREALTRMEGADEREMLISVRH